MFSKELLPYSSVKITSFTFSSYQKGGNLLWKGRHKKRGGLRREWVVNVELSWASLPIQDFLYFQKISQLPSSANTSSYLSPFFSEHFFFFFLLTISTACRRPSLSTFHPYLYSPSHFNLLQFFAYLIQTRSLHHHKTSIMTHLSPTFMSFFFTFKINSMCYYAKYVLLWLWYIQLVLQFPLLHLSASLMQLWSTTDISGDPHTGRME